MSTDYFSDASENYNNNSNCSFVKKCKKCTIISEPGDVTTKVGNFIKLSTIITSPNPSYQWYDGSGRPIPNKTQSTLFIGPVKEEDFGFYKLEIIDRTTGEKKYTSWVEVKKCEQTFYPTKPRVTVTPRGGLFRRGDTVRLYGSFENAVYYQWYKDGHMIEGCTNTNLSIRSCNSSSSGRYVLMAWNTFGTETTQEVDVMIR
ncbi:hypothetical protein LOD99_14869 [Oopsacas minuta]|uniref:Immunoglobulin domain-containing protein n=1 Tax=Oopsacas minuta TaxID=111878 RepID=A0AAV7KEA9_9METZ|nr:hypothetical protein LOD99_14869 [Oopsacas minuta]